MLRSIKSRLTLLYVSIFGLILIAFAASLFAITRQDVMADLERTLARQARAFAEFYFRQPPDRRTVDADTYLATASGVAAVYDAQGRSLFRSQELRSVGRLDFDRLNREFFSEGGRRFCVTRARDGSGVEYVVALGMDETAVRERLLRLLGYFAIFVPVVLAITWYVGFLFVRAALAPVETIRARAERLSRENLSERLLLPKTRGEIRELAATFNDMLGRLERAFSQTQQFTANASHELKTPLANLRTEIELALEKDADAEEYQRLLASVVEEVSRMSHIVENLLLLAQLDRGSAPLSREAVDLSGVAREAVDAMQIMGETRGVKVREGLVAPQVRVTGDSVMLRRVVMNLLENGVKYNREGGEVKCSVWREDGTARLEVADNGPGIPDDAIPHLFERFFRVDQGRTHARADVVGGTGLGLSICKSLVEAHGGSIDVKSREGAGTTFHVTLPAA